MLCGDCNAAAACSHCYSAVLCCLLLLFTFMPDLASKTISERPDADRTSQKLEVNAAKLNNLGLTHLQTTASLWVSGVGSSWAFCWRLDGLMWNITARELGMESLDLTMLHGPTWFKGGHQQRSPDVVITHIWFLHCYYQQLVYAFAVKKLCLLLVRPFLIWLQF